MENKILVPAEERSQVARAVCAWLNSCESKPVKKIDFEYIGDTGMCVSSVQSAYKTRQYVLGGYEAQYQFHIVYRSRPTTADARLKMDEILDTMAEWCLQSLPALEGNMVAQRVECTNGAALSARYDDSTEDHAVQLNLIYEVNV